VDPVVRRRVLLGYSVARRPITAVEIGDPDSPRRALVVGCIHGNEPAGIAVDQALAAGPAPAEVDLWLLTDLNPDGVAAGTRQNAHGVDLNRNFPAGWRSATPGSVSYSGPLPLSEPESRLAAALIRRIHPGLSIWFHQHLTVVDDSEGPLAVEARFARLVGLPERSLTDYPGSVVGWENALLGPTAFVVELPAGSLTASTTQRYAAAVRDVLP